MIKEKIGRWVCDIRAHYHSCSGHWVVLDKWLEKGVCTGTVWCFRCCECPICGKKITFHVDQGYNECILPDTDSSDWGNSIELQTDRVAITKRRLERSL